MFSPLTSDALAVACCPANRVRPESRINASVVPEIGSPGREERVREPESLPEDESMLQKVLMIAWLMMLLFPGFAHPQAGAEDPQQTEPPKNTAPLGARSFIGDTFSNMRNVVGFSLGMNQLYEHDILHSTNQRQSVNVSSVFPRVYLNLGRQRHQFHADYGFGYRYYHEKQELNTTEHYASASYDYQVTARSSIRISDDFTSSPNWYGASFGPLLSLSNPTPGFSTELTLERQRIVRNYATGSFNYQATQKISLAVFGVFGSYRYDSQDLPNVNSLQAGLNYNHQITRWLFLTNSYSAYLNNVDERYQDARIHRLQVGGLQFRLGRSWEATAGGGIEYVKTYDENRLGESISAGLAWNTEANTFGFNYHRGFYSAIGIASVLQSDQGIVTLGSRMTRWLNLQLSMSFLRGFERIQSGRIRQYHASAGVDFALRSDLVASINGVYVNQTGTELGSIPLDFERYVAYVGLQYVFPGSRR
jgi:hypothetical protein